MIYQLMIVLALAMHQLNRICRDGIAGLGDNYAPVFGVAPPRRAIIALHLLAVPIASGLLILQMSGLAALVLVVWAAAQNWRLPNHVFLAVTWFVGLTFLGPDEQVTWTRSCLAVLYLSAGTFKLNWQFLMQRESCARLLLEIHARRSYSRFLRRFPSAMAPIVVLMVELALGVGLLTSGNPMPLVVLAILLHLSFGVTSNFPFSLVCIALWIQAIGVDLDGLGSRTETVALIVGAVAGVVFAVRPPVRWLYRSRTSAAVAMSAMAGAYVGLSSIALGAGVDSWPALATSTVILVCATYAVNVATVALGWRTEFAFAMFANVRPLGSVGVLGIQPRWRAEYFTLSLPERIPVRLFDVVPGHLLARATSGREVVAGPVAWRWERAAARLGSTLRPTRVCYRPGTHQLQEHPDPSRPRNGLLLFPPLLPADPSIPVMR